MLRKLDLGDWIDLVVWARSNTTAIIASNAKTLGRLQQGIGPGSDVAVDHVISVDAQQFDYS